MIEIKQNSFNPSVDNPADLTTNISFTLTSLKNKDGNEKIDGQSFQNLTDEEVRDILKENESAIFYVNTDPNAPQSKTVIDNLTLASISYANSVDRQNIDQEVSRVSSIRDQVRATVSSFVAIEYKTGDTYTQIVDTQFTIKDFNNSEIRTRRASRGDILDIAKTFNKSGTTKQVPLRTNIVFTNFVETSSEKYAIASFLSTVEQTNVITVNDPTPFIKGSNVCCIISQAFLPQDQLSNPRDIILFQIKEIDIFNKKLTLIPTNGYGLFTKEEINCINVLKGRMIVITGTPILFSSSGTTGFRALFNSLNDARDGIENAIPRTILYKPIFTGSDQSTRIGNLNRSSINVTLLEDDQETLLVEKGEATPGVSIDFKLIKTIEGGNIGNVDALIKLSAPSVGIPISGIAEKGSNAIRLAADIRSTPDKTATKSPSAKTAVVSTTLIPIKTDKIATKFNTPSEYYFTKKITLSTGQSVNLTKIGTIRVNDEVIVKKIVDSNKQELFKAKISGVDVNNSSIILDRLVPMNLGTANTAEEQAVMNNTRYEVEIPQTPFNPGRSYRIIIDGSDFDETSPGIHSTFTFKTKTAPQAPGKDGAHWEKLPISLLPTMDLSRPESTANSIAASMSNLQNSFKGFRASLEATTQSLQNAACDLGSLANTLSGAITFADEFAKANNKTQIYVRAIGVDPIGTIKSKSSFMAELNTAMSDAMATGNILGKIPSLVPAEIPLEPISIANALGSNKTLAESALTGGPTLKGDLGTISLGEKIRKLSNDNSFRKGFSISTVSFSIVSISQNSIQSKVIIETSNNSLPSSFTIQSAQNIGNNGSFNTIQTKNIKSSGKKYVEITYNNSKGSTESTSTGLLTFSGSDLVPASTAVKTALEQEGLYGPKVVRKTIPVTQLINILIKYKLIGVNTDKAEEDKSIASERLIRLASSSTAVMGGIVLVGKAPNVSALSRKILMLSQVMEFLEPLAKKLSSLALTDVTASPSGVSFDPTTVEIDKLNKTANIGKKDSEAAIKQVQNSGVNKEITPILLSSDDKDIPEGKYDVWRHYPPIQLWRSTANLVGGSFADSAGDSFEANSEKYTSTYPQSAAASTINAAAGGLNSLIAAGKQQLEKGTQFLQSQADSIDVAADEMNIVNKKITDALNLLRSISGMGPVTLDAHLIGPKLNIQSNSEFTNAVNVALGDITDPNRPTFGTSASTSVLDNQTALKNAVQGNPTSSLQSTLWFGVILVVVGKNRQDLGEQLKTITSFVNMDSSAIDIPDKQKYSFQGLKL